MKKLILIPLMIVFAISLNSCNNDSSSSGSYSYKVRMTDDPGPYSEVNVDIQSVQVIGAGGQTVSLNTNAGIYNLLDFSNGADTLIASSTLNSAAVSQIRLILGPNNTIVLDGVTYPINQAKKLLLQDKTVSDACYETGFENLSHFNKTFKKFSGENPSAFRKSQALYK